MAAVYWRDLRFLVHFRKSHPVVIAFFARREFISIRIVSIVTYQKKKKNLGDISSTIPLDSGEEFQFWNTKIGILENSP